MPPVEREVVVSRVAAFKSDPRENSCRKTGQTRARSGR